ncbi:MAG TPA: 30S ribosomal protein S20 [Myxococcaceae bacterium]|nr:30S ribosomal protein S20 [Myxococcaceae bacterium]
MANTKSAQKRNRVAEKRRLRNAAVRTSVRTAIKNAREAIASKDPQRAVEAIRAATQTLDKAASKGVLHARNAARRIARLAHAWARQAAQK